MKNALTSIRRIRSEFITTQLLRMIRLTGILLLAASLHLSAKSVGQNITLSLKNVPIQKVFDKIIDQSGISIVYNEEILKSIKPVSVDIQNATIEQAMQVCLKDLPLSFTISGNSVIVAPRLTLRSDGQSLVFEIPPITVKGKIVNENGEPVVASVMIKGTSRGITSDANGEFVIEDINSDAELIITSANTETTSVKINNRTSINISIRSAISDLDAVIINKGYYLESKRLATGNVSKVDAKTIEKQPVNNPLLALQGRMAGVAITQLTGVAGGAVNIEIRGRNSLRVDGNGPLYIIDGVPFNATPLGSVYSGAITQGGSPLNGLNPNDISGIEILKDADATAIYGSRGANGVVLITTKRGKAGKTGVELNYYQGVGKVPHMMKLLNTQQYLEMRNEAFENDAMDPVETDVDVNGKWNSTKYTNWQKQLIGGTAKLMNAQIAFSGGNENTQFLISGGYGRETNVFPGNFYDRKIAVHFNINHTSIDKKFNILASGGYVDDYNNLPSTDLSNAAVSLPPNVPDLYTPGGGINWDEGSFQNPISYLFQKYNLTTNNIIGNTVLSYKLFPGLTLKSNLGYSKFLMKEKFIAPSSSINPFTSAPFSASAFGNREISTWIVEPQMQYSKKMGRNDISAIVGATFQGTNTDKQLQYATGFVSDLLLENIRAASTIRVDENIAIKYRYNALFGRLNYTYANKYILNLTGRRDGSSRFGPGKQFANFGAVGGAWVFSEETFLKNALSIINYGKLRCSYGTTGSDQIGDYQFYSLWNPTTYLYGSNPAVYAFNLYNENFAWEVNRKLEIGADLSFLSDRAGLSVSYYRNRSANQLIGINLPATTGFLTIQSNFDAEVENKGVEIELRTLNVKRNQFSWNSSFNITIPKNKLLAYPDIMNSSFQNILAVGQSLNVVKSFYPLGVDPENGSYFFRDMNGNGDGTDYPADLQIVGNLGQKFFGGLNNTLIYRNFQLDVFVQFTKQKAYDYMTYFTYPPGTMGNQPEEVMERWRKTGDLTHIQKFTQGADNAYVQYYNHLNAVISDASFIRVKNVSLSYNLNQNLLNRIKISGANIYVHAQNLFTFTSYKGLDPETLTLSLPPLRMITAGIKLTL